MKRILSAVCFCLALSMAVLLKNFGLAETLVWLVSGNVLFSVLMIRLTEIPTPGFAGLGGFSLAAWKLASISIPGLMLSITGGFLLALAILICIQTDSIPASPNSSIRGIKP